MPIVIAVEMAILFNPMTLVVFFVLAALRSVVVNGPIMLLMMVVVKSFMFIGLV